MPSSAVGRPCRPVFNPSNLSRFPPSLSRLRHCPCLSSSSQFRGFSSSSASSNPLPIAGAPGSSPFSDGLQSFAPPLQKFLSQLLEDYLCPLLLPVQWGDQDPLGHVNNTIYARYAESARIHSMYAVFLASEFSDSERAAAANYITLSPSTKSVGPIIKSLNLKYKFPVVFPDTVLIGTRLSEIELDRFTLDHRIVSVNHRRIVCEASAVVVSYHYGTLKKAEKTPQEVQHALLRWQTIQEKKLEELRSAATHLNAERAE